AAVTIAADLGCGVLVNLGGDIRVAGPPPAGGWRVGIADDVGFDGGPGADHEPGTGCVVMLRAGGLATSGTAVRSWRRGSARLHHIIVPATGLPAASCWRAGSVTAATRAAGLVTLLLLTASVLLGVMTAGRFSSDRWPRFLTAGLHRNISLLVLVFLVLHVGTTVLDTFVSVPVIAVFVPFASSYKTF